MITDNFKFEKNDRPDAVREHETAIFAKRVTEIPSNLQQRIAYNATKQTEYVGWAARGIAAGDDGWLLHKITYTSNQVTLRQVAYGNWTNRASESYA